MQMFSKRAKTLQKYRVRTVIGFGDVACRLIFSYGDTAPLMQVLTGILSSPFVNTAMKSSVLATVTMYLPDSMTLSFSPRFVPI
jgi:hypothetical protein